MKIKDLLKNVPYTLLQGSVEAEVTGLCHDSRMLRRGDAFVCLRGARFDTHTLAKQLAENGAALLVMDHDADMPSDPAVTVVRVEDSRRAEGYLACSFYGDPASQMTTVAVTGSKGKTTACQMMAAIFRQAGYRTGTVGTNGAIMPESPEIAKVCGADRYHAAACEETPGHVVYELDNTTPDAISLQMYLSMMVKAGCTHAVIEVSSQAEKLQRTAGMVFDYGIWTNIVEGDHIGPNEHKDFEEYLSCKAQLINQSRIGLVNADDPHLSGFLRYVTLPDGTRGTKRRLFTYGTGRNADFRGSGLTKTYSEEKRTPYLYFTVSENKTKNGEGKAASSGFSAPSLPMTVHVNEPGDFNMYNALGPLVVASHLGIGPEVADQALSHLHIRGRFDMVFDNGHFRVCVDFAHNGYSTRNHLTGLREFRPKRLVCVYSADGNRSINRRLEMGEAAASLADFSIITSGHNRYETFEAICRDILTGVENAEKKMGRKPDYMVIPNREKAIRYAIQTAQEGDMITIIDLGHESYQEENGVKIPHSDIEFVRRTVRELGLTGQSN